MPNKRILILMHYMMLGGAESALLGLLQAHAERVAAEPISETIPQIDLFVYDHRGELMPYIHELERMIPNTRFRLLPSIAEYTMLERPLSELLQLGYWRMAMRRFLGKMEARLTHGSEFVCQQRWTVRILPKIAGHYDVAISFLTPHYIVQHCVDADKRVGWIHTDYTQIAVHPGRELPMWQALDGIISISEEVTHTFLRVFPILHSKILMIENILSPAFIRKRAQEQAVKLGNRPQSIQLLTIGRFSPPKKMEDIPILLRLLREQGIDAEWSIIGYGSNSIEQKVCDQVEKEHVVPYLHILGKKDNPYPYIQACDVYVQPSRYEGKSITVREAQILCKPVVVTAYATATSQIHDGIDGVIVPMEVESCATRMVTFIQDIEKREAIRDYLCRHDNGSEQEIEKIYAL